MGIYVHERCHACKTSLTGGYVPDYYAVGEPLVECAGCGAFNNRASKCNEWILMSKWRKAKLILLFTYTGLGYSIFVGLLIAFVGSYLMTGDYSSKASGQFLADNIDWIAVVAVIGGLGLSFRGLRSAIHASNIRMSDPYYLAKLKYIGLLNQSSLDK